MEGRANGVSESKMGGMENGEQNDLKGEQNGCKREQNRWKGEKKMEGKTKKNGTKRIKGRT